MAPLPVRTLSNRPAHMSADCPSRPSPTLLTGKAPTHAMHAHCRAASSAPCSSARQSAALEQRSSPPFAGGGRRRRRSIEAAAAPGTLQTPAHDTDELPVQRGETAGAALVLEDITIQAGDRDLLEVCTCAMSSISKSLTPDGLVVQSSRRPYTMMGCGGL